MNLLFISADLAPLCGDSSLGRVVAQLTDALSTLGHKVTICVPLVDHDVIERRSLARRLSPVVVELPGRRLEVAVFDGRLPSGVAVKVLAHDELFLGRPWDGGADAAEVGPLPLALLARAALALAAGEPTTYDLLHGVSLAGALACHLASGEGAAPQRRVLSIASLEDQGRWPREWVDRLGLDWSLFTPEGFEFFGDLCLLKAGLLTAERILLPGPWAVVGARSEVGGSGLEGVVRSRGDAVVGLAPGLDFSRWNPATDAQIASRYDAEVITGKGSCKADLQNRLGLPVRLDLPLVALLPPLADLARPVAQGLERLLRADVQLVAPRGLARPLEGDIDEALGRWPDRVARVELDERAEHQLLAGADFVVLDAPADVEGRQLLAALRYGALPVVPRGGLARDAVVDVTGSLESGSGFVLPGTAPAEVLATLRRAAAAFGRCGGGERPLHEVVRRAMRLPRSWEDAARRLEQVYAELLPVCDGEPCADAP